MVYTLELVSNAPVFVEFFYCFKTLDSRVFLASRIGRGCWIPVWDWGNRNINVNHANENKCVPLPVIPNPNEMLR